MKGVFETIGEKWKNLKTGFKYAIGLGIFSVVTLVSFLLALPDGFTPLYQNLSEEDKQDILVELSKLGVEYEIDESSQTISVQEKDVSWVRARINELGLPQSGVDYTAYLEGGLGDTESQRQFKEINFKKGQLENELVRVFPFIEKATVTLSVPPETSIFESEPAKGSASVTVGMKTGHTLTRSQMIGIQNMVSSALQGVPAEEVKIIDNEKGIISTDLEENMYSSTAYEKQMEIREKTEERIKSDINETLATIFGFSNVKLNVRVDINFDKVERQIESFGDEGVLRSSNSQLEETRKTEDADLEEAGVDANGEVIGYEVDEEGNVIHYEQNKENVTENYEIDKTVETIIENPELTNTNIAIWLDKDELDKRPEFDMEAFREAIAISAGVKPTGEGNFENGYVSVFSESFYVEPELEEEEMKVIVKSPVQQFIEEHLMWIVIGGVVFIFLFVFLLMLLLKKKKKQKKLEEVEINAVEVQPVSPQSGETNPSVESKPEQAELISDNLTDNLGEKLTFKNTLPPEKLLGETEEERREREEQILRQQQLEEHAQKLSAEYPKETAEYIRKLLYKRR